MATTQAATRPIPDSFSAMYPGRFMKADGFKGKKLLFTIKAIFGEDLLSSEDEATKQEWITQFEDTRLEWVMNKTNAYCLFRMFGGDPHTWVGKRIVLYGQPGVWFGEKGEAIRVYGSPDIAEDLPITLRFLRKKKDRNMVMKKVSDPKEKAAVKNDTHLAPTVPVPVSGLAFASVDPRITAAFGILGWTPAECNAYIAKTGDTTQKDILADLNRIIDEQNAAQV